jgi:DNA gyrase/topoisomerase IV subunit A
MTYDEKARFRPQLLENARGMLADVGVLVEAVERMSEIVSTIQSAESRSEAADRLQARPFNYNEWQAFQVLDLSVASQTGAGAAVLQQRRDELAQAVRKLEEPIEPPDPD